MTPDGERIRAVSLITTEANTVVGAIHDRMPAVLPREHFGSWLDCRSGSSVAAVPMLSPAPDDVLEVLEVSRAVNNVRNEGPELQTPVGRTTLL